MMTAPAEASMASIGQQAQHFNPQRRQSTFDKRHMARRERCGCTTDASGSQSWALSLVRVRRLSPSSGPKQLSKSLQSRQLGELHSEKPSASQSLR